ncbi:uncharacterized protein PG986_012197 [Apiospora aurea]|uniref:Uncharacterized protein n=1 Tax=Apiospora aurea TaxID=335848 RepID=A0ABR1PZA7_9PEZI
MIISPDRHIGEQKPPGLSATFEFRYQVGQFLRKRADNEAPHQASFRDIITPIFVLFVFIILTSYSIYRLVHLARNSMSIASSSSSSDSSSVFEQEFEGDIGSDRETCGHGKQAHRRKDPHVHPDEDEELAAAAYTPADDA